MDLLGTELPLLKSAVPGPRSQALMDTLAAVECPALTARRARRAERSGAPRDPIAWAAARGAVVADADGNRFVDTTGGFGVALLGHGHPPVVQAVREQAGTLLHALGDVHPSERKVQLMGRLAQLAPWPARAILGLSGADAVEAALKTSMLHTGKPGVVAFEGGYHGLSHGPLALCGYGERFRPPFHAQLNPHVRFAPYPTEPSALDGALAAVEAALAELGSAAGAVIVEPVQGRGGVRVPSPGFLRALSELCRRAGVLLIVDEIYTGLGRTGPRFRHTADGCQADLICVGKALGGGLPLSACLGREDVMTAWGEPSGEAIHTSTFSGNPLACAAALVLLSELEEERAQSSIARAGSELRARLSAVAARHGASVRGAGLLLGYAPARGEQVLPLMAALLDRGYIVLPAGAPPEVLCFTPPTCITPEQMQGLCEALDEASTGLEAQA